MKTKLTAACLLGLALAAGPAVPAATEADEFVPLRIDETVEPVFPPELERLAVSDGSAKIVISVDETGRLMDCLAVAYSHPDFAQAAMAALKHWRFLPATLGGEPLGSVREIDFNFEDRQLVVNQTATDNVRSLMFALMRQDYVWRICTPRELDRPPELIHAVRPVYPARLAQRGAAAAVTVEFYIDEQGAVRMPAITGPAEPALAQAAVAAVQQWKFAPPLRRGRPALVQASQTFVFDAKS